LRGIGTGIGSGGATLGRRRMRLHGGMNKYVSIGGEIAKAIHVMGRE